MVQDHVDHDLPISPGHSFGDFPVEKTHPWKRDWSELTYEFIDFFMYPPVN